jgi:hypothetical protein
LPEGKSVYIKGGRKLKAAVRKLQEDGGNPFNKRLNTRSFHSVTVKKKVTLEADSPSVEVSRHIVED